jgi:hypothetical protein
MDQLTGPAALVAADWLSRGAVAGVKSADPFGDQKLLHGWAGASDFVADVAGTQAALSAKLDDPASALDRRLVR